MKRLKFPFMTLLMLLIPLSVLGSGTGLFTVFGPETYVRGAGKPETVVKSFSVLNPDARYFIKITNEGASSDKGTQVSSAVIWINGSKIVEPNEFNQKVTLIEKPVILEKSSNIAAELRGAPGSTLRIEVYGIDNEPPVITAVVTPQPNANGWNNSDVTVHFDCEDGISGISSCPTPVTVTNETIGQVISGTAMDRAGNTATASVTVRLDKTPPVIIGLPTPQPNAAGWNNADVTVNFSCDDPISGVVACPSPVTVTTQGVNQISSGIAIDRAGNVAAGSLTVRLDKTPPQIAVTWPLVPTFATDRTSISLEGTLSDSVSGIASGFVTDPSGSASLGISSFSVSRSLQTGIPAGAVYADTPFELTAVDLAGNEAHNVVVGRYTLEPVMLPTDPAQTELSGGIKTSVNRALVHFKPGVTRDQVHEIAGAYNGRVAGFLPTTNTALVVFNTTSVGDLKSQLQAVRQSGEVAAAVPVVFFQAQQAVTFDNDLLTPSQRVAYDSIEFSKAAQLIIDQDIPRSPVRLVFIDSGIDTSFGSNNEFGGVMLYDLCTVEGQQGQTSSSSDVSGHGTMMTGMAAAANNSSGNNGILRGIPGLNGTVMMLKAACSAGSGDLDGALITLALESIVRGGLGTTIFTGETRVVNLSFGLGSEDAEAKQWLSWFFLPHFASKDGGNILWVASAGNNNAVTACDGFLMYPAGLACTLQNVISVGGYDPADLLRSSPSNYGPAVTLYAPAANVYTPTGTNTYGFAGGTSSAAALASGAASLLMSVKSQSPSEVKEIMRLSRQPLNDSSLSQGGLDIYNMMLFSGFHPLAHDTETGNSSGGQELPQVQDLGMSGITGFGFSYASDDHHLYQISTGNFFHNTDWGYQYIDSFAVINYRDDNGDDDYSWDLSRQELPPGTSMHEVSDCDNYGGFNKVLLPPGYYGVPVLTGFSLRFTNGDHHLNTLRAELFYDQFSQLELGVTYADKNSDDPYCYRVTYALVPLDRVHSVATENGSSGGTSVSRAINATRPVLQGFKLDFSNEDHHIHEVGVEVTQSTLSVRYNDQNDDDDFTWWVRYVDLK